MSFPKRLEHPTGSLSDAEIGGIAAFGFVSLVEALMQKLLLLKF
jgi:hypothetical protein